MGPVVTCGIRGVGVDLASRMELLGTESAFAVLAKAKALEARGRDVIHLEIGEPDFDTPEHIVEAGCQALRDGQTHYTPSNGIVELREAIAEDVSASRGIAVSPDQVVVTPGGKPIMFFIILALVEEGDEVLLPNPAFPIYESMVRFAGGKPVFVPLRQENDFRFDPDEFRAGLSNRTKLVILNSPANPTGGVLTREDISALATILREHPGAFVLSDEIYSRLTYEESSFSSITSEPGFGPGERTCILDGFSKTYAMTGWRLGYGVMPEGMAEAITRLQVNSNSCASAVAQHAGLAALQGPQDNVGRMLDEFRARRDLVVSGLNALPGVECATPKGAFYAFPRITGTGLSAQTLADTLLEDAGVACLSGTGFGKRGEGHLRLSYANSRENIARALERMDEVLSRTAARKARSKPLPAQ